MLTIVALVKRLRDGTLAKLTRDGLLAGSLVVLVVKEGSLVSCG